MLINVRRGVIFSAESITLAIFISVIKSEIQGKYAGQSGLIDTL